MDELKPCPFCGYKFNAILTNAEDPADIGDQAFSTVYLDNITASEALALTSIAQKQENRFVYLQPIPIQEQKEEE